MKVCIVVDNLNQSAGWGRLAHNLRQHLIPLGYEVGFIAQEGSIEGARVTRVTLRGFSVWRPRHLLGSIMTIRRAASAYDLVLCIDLNPYGFTTALALLGLRTRLVVYCLGTYSLLTQSVLRNALMRLAVRRADRILIVGEFVREQIRASGLSLVAADILPVGVDTQFFHKVSEKLVDVREPYIVGVGGVKSRKGFHLALEAFGKVADRFPAYTYVIAGSIDGGEYYKKLVARASELGLEDRVLFLQGLNDLELRSLYSHASLFVLTPVTERDAIEGFGMVYLEAALCGQPSIGTLGSGAVEAIEDRESGLLVEPVPEKIAEALTRVLGDSAYRQMLSDNAIERARLFSWERVASRLDLILKEIK